MNTRELVILALLLCATRSNAFDVETHRLLSQHAIENSNFATTSARLGIDDLDHMLPTMTVESSGVSLWIPSAGSRTIVIPTPSNCFSRDQAENRTVIAIVGSGAFCEDATISGSDDKVARYTNHFFDASHRGAGFHAPYISGMSSADWAIDTEGIAGQNHSYADFRDQLYLGVTSRSSADRRLQMSMAFASLGHVMHLIEDVAQPQHTRNDAHGMGSAYEAYTDIHQKELKLEGYQSANIQVRTLRDIWTTLDGKGLADYSNRGFVTAGTNFRGSAEGIVGAEDYPEPSGLGATTKLLSIDSPELSASCPGITPLTRFRGVLTFVSSPVRDSNLGTEATNERASTYSIYDEDLSIHGRSRVFSQNRFNFCAANDLLIPRAIAYAEAFVDFAFRGDLEVTNSAGGVIGVTNIVDRLCVGTCGFRKFKVQVRNSSRAGESMGRGKLVAVARYHLNSCFRTDLAGQPNTPGFSGFACRSPESFDSLDEYVSVSEAVSVDSISSESKVPVTFEFKEAEVPLGATDLHLQIVFRGQLGMEDNAIAVGSKDVREPTFLTFTNDNDYIGVYASDGHFLRAEKAIDPLSAVYTHYSLVDFRVSAYLDEQDMPVLARADRLDPGYFTRIAVISDSPRISYRIDYTFGSDTPEQIYAQAFELDAAHMQVRDGGNWLVTPAYIKLREARPNEWIYHPETPGATIYWTQGYRCNDGSANCVTEDRTVGEQVRRFPSFAQPTPSAMRIEFNQ